MRDYGQVEDMRKGETMKPEEMGLPNLDKVEFLSSASFRKEWVIDPPPFIWWRLKEDILINVLQVKMKYLAELTKLEARAKELEGEMFKEIGQTLGK